jgi:crossover junction endodeoxyribonuclease RuvC
MLILGIDPGFAITGWGLVEADGRAGRLRFVACGSVDTPAGTELPERLVLLYDGLRALMAEHRPDAVAVEELFFNKNTKSALHVGHGRGVAVLAAAQSGVKVHEYTPLQVKQSVAAYGRADKQQVQSMVKTLLGLREVPKPDDAADALAVAICHAHAARMNEILGGKGMGLGR